MEKRIHRRDGPYRSKVYRTASGGEDIEISTLTEGIVLVWIENRKNGSSYKTSAVLLDVNEEAGMEAEDLFYTFLLSSLKEYTEEHYAPEEQKCVLERLAKAIMNLNIDLGNYER